MIMPALGVLAVSSAAVAQTPADTAQALRSQVLDAYNAGQSAVTIAPGDYEVATDGSANIILSLDGLNDFTINADGVRLVAKELKQVVRFSNASDLTVNGLSVDYDPLPFTQGRIVQKRADNTRFTVELDEGYDYYLGQTRVIAYDPASHIVKPGSATRYGFDVIAADRPDRVRVEGAAIGDSLQIGDLVTLTRDDDIQVPHAIRLADSTGVTFNDVTVHASTSFGLFETGGGNNTFNGYSVTPGQAPSADGTERLLSANADGFHSKYTTVGPQVTQATIRAQGDDGIAISAAYLPIGQGNAGGNAITVASRASSINDHLAIGDTLRIYDAEAGTTVEAIVTGIAEDDSLDWADVREQHFPELNTGSNSYTRGFTITLDRDISVDAGDFVANPDRNAAGFSVTDSTIENHRARGIIVKASDGEIRDNVVDGSTIAGIVVTPEPFLWLESDFANDVDIVGNTVRNTGQGVASVNQIQAGAISVTGPAEWTGERHADILIDGNTVEDVSGANLVLTDANSVTVSNNNFISPNQSISSTGSANGVDANAVIWVDDADGVEFLANTVVNPGPANSALVRVTENTGGMTNRFGGVTQAHGDKVEVVADYRDDFATPSATGWSYLWNPDGDIGDPENYVALQPTADGEYTIDGTAVPNADPAAFLRFGPTFAHPGLGSQQADRDYFAIAAYTVDMDGEYAIRDSLIETSPDTGGVNILIHINGSAVPFADSFSNFSVATFDVRLGQLMAGDEIYVAIGPSGLSSFDFVNLDFSIARTVIPEPGSAMLLLTVSPLLGWCQRGRNA